MVLWGAKANTNVKGTESLLAGMDPMTGEFISLVRNTHKSSDVIDFQKLLDDKYDKEIKSRLPLIITAHIPYRKPNGIWSHILGG